MRKIMYVIFLLLILSPASCTVKQNEIKRDENGINDSNLTSSNVQTDSFKTQAEAIYESVTIEKFNRVTENEYLSKNIVVADINGDGDQETIELIRDSIHYAYSLLIFDSNNQALYQEVISEIGAGAYITVGDFNGSGVDDIFISIDSGGTGGDVFYWLISFENNVYEEISLDKIQTNKAFTFELKDNHVTIYSDILNKNEEFTLSGIMQKKVSEHTDDSIYLGPIWLEPLDLDNDNIMELKYRSFLKANYKCPIAVINMAFKYADGDWLPLSLSMEPIED